MNVFDQFDEIKTPQVPETNVFDQFDIKPPSAFGAMTNSAVDMATFGMKPIAAGLGGALAEKVKGSDIPFGDLYDRFKEEDKSTQAIGAAEHPFASAAGDVLGLAGSAPAKALGEAANAGQSLWQIIKSQAPVNAGIGFASGFGNANGNFGNRLATGAVGAGLGTVLSAATPLAMKGVGIAASPIANVLVNKFGSPEKAALNKISQKIEQDMLTPDKITSGVVELGPEGALVDAGGQNIQGLARGLTVNPGEPREIASQFFNQRQAGQGDRILSHVGPDTDFHGTLSDLQEQQKKIAEPLYKQAYAENKNVTSPIIDKILETPAGQKALSGAVKSMQNEMALVAVPDKELAAQAKLAGQYVPGGVSSGLKLKTLDLVKQELDSQYQQAVRAGDNAEARRLGTMAAGLRSELDRLDVTAKGGKPGLYSQARAAFSGPAKSIDAAEMGRTFLKEDSEITAKQLADLSDSDKAFARIGMQRAITDRVKSTPDGADAVKRIFGNKGMREKMAQLFPSQAAFLKFTQQMQAEAKMYQTRANVTQGSRTAPMMAEGEEAGLDAGHLLEAAKGNWLGAGTKMIGNIFGSLAETSPEAQKIMAQRLMTSDQQTNAATIQAIKDAIARQAENAKRNAQFMKLIGAHGAATFGNMAGTQ